MEPQNKVLEEVSEILEIINGSDTVEDKLKVIQEKIVNLKEFIEGAIFM